MHKQNRNKRKFTFVGEEVGNLASNKLLARAKSGDINALFHIGIVALTSRKIGFAMCVFSDAGKRGHKRSSQYYLALKKAGRKIDLYVDLILSAERSELGFNDE